MTATSVTFPANAETEALAVGHVIASATRTDHPYLGKITSIQKSGGSITFQITQAALTDLFDDINWSQTIMMGSSDTADGSQAIRPGGLHLEKSDLGRRRRR